MALPPPPRQYQSRPALPQGEMWRGWYGVCVQDGKALMSRWVAMDILLMAELLHHLGWC